MGAGGRWVEALRSGVFTLLEWQYSTNNRPDLSDDCTNSTYLLAGGYAIIYFDQWVGGFLPIPKWGISGFEIYAFAEIINKPGKRKSESDRPNPQSWKLTMG